MAVVSDVKASSAFTGDSANKQVDTELDTGRGAGDRFGDLGDSGGGDNNHGKGDGVGESREKKMALSMSQKLTLGYAALAGGLSTALIGKLKESNLEREILV